MSDEDNPDRLARGIATDPAQHSGANPIHQVDRFSPALGVLETPEWRRLVQELDGSLRRATEPLAALSTGLAHSAELRRSSEIIRQLHFALPETDTIARVTRLLQIRGLPELGYSRQMETLQRSMQAMSAPWLNIENALRSVCGFAEMQGIGQILALRPTFDNNVTETLRRSLGDWREPISWSAAILTDVRARKDFYEERGFDSALTDFPAPAFHQGLELAGLRRQPPPLVEEYGELIPSATDDNEERALERTNVAHNWLLRLESQIRVFVDTLMTQAFGPGWPENRLPNGMFEQWRDKKNNLESRARRARPLIAYADFTDYPLMICKRDNWREVFSPHFRQPESVRETFQRLHPIRLDTMHARSITKDDELLLYVETRRLVRVILPDA